SPLSLSLPVFLFLDPPPPALSPLSLHDALPISDGVGGSRTARQACRPSGVGAGEQAGRAANGGGTWRVARPAAPQEGGLGERPRSEEHTSELQSRFDLVCRLLLEKKNIIRSHLR